MADIIVYRGFEVHATPYKLQAGSWAYEGHLIEHRGGSTRETKIFADGSSPSREQAVQAVLAEARRLIDFRSEDQSRTA
jgi:hypothetical protein